MRKWLSQDNLQLIIRDIAWCMDLIILKVNVPAKFSGTKGFPLHRDGRYMNSTNFSTLALPDGDANYRPALKLNPQFLDTFSSILSDAWPFSLELRPIPNCVGVSSGLKNCIAVILPTVADLIYSDRYVTNGGLSSPPYIVFNETLVPRISIKVKPKVFFLYKFPFPLFDIIVNPNIILIDCV